MKSKSIFKKSSSMIKKLLFIIIFLTLSATAFFFFIKDSFLPASNNIQEITVLVPKGSSVTQIGNILEKNKIIKSSLALKFYVQLTNSQNKIQAGEFEISPSLSLIQVVERLKKGPKEIFVTIPEGVRREEIAVKFAKALNKDQDFILEFLKLTEDKEGYLFPDTYLFPKSATAQSIVNRMTSTFENKVGQINSEQLIMASLLERETLGDEEKPIVAGILFKRLDNDWPLQVDATLQYAKDSVTCKNKIEGCEYWEPIYVQDKEIDSKFNTYKYLGLPPAPISNPGLATLIASKNPENSDYWYYIHDNSGQIHYARTLDEHNSNIAKYLR